MSFQWPKYCTNCGRPIRKKSWSNLKLLGEMGAKNAKPEDKFEMRNCGCGSTLMVPSPSTRKSDPPPAA